ncbi:MAG: regulatory protein RecX [Lachnospiraceae bacterium]
MDGYEITECVPSGKTRHRVTLDGEYTFQLYNNEVRKYHIQSGEILSKELLFEIQDILYKRGLSRCLHLIKDRDYTYAAIVSKLRDGDYPGDIIDKVCARLVEEGFINDGRYARNYVIANMNTKSRKQMAYGLMSKGISAELIEEAFDDLDELYGNDTEVENVMKLLTKKLGNKDITVLDYEARMKIFAYAGRKGYGYEVIKKAWDSLHI